jgi:hypothetical protein
MVSRAVSCLLGETVICDSALPAPAQDCPDLAGWCRDGRCGFTWFLSQKEEENATP